MYIGCLGLFQSLTKSINLSIVQNSDFSVCLNKQTSKKVEELQHFSYWLTAGAVSEVVIGHIL